MSKRKLFQKLRSRRGETFIEILFAILLAAFGCVLIGTLYSAAMSLNIQASRSDDEYYGALTEMEQMMTGGESTKGKVTITEEGGNSLDVSVKIYGGDSDNSSYKR